MVATAEDGVTGLAFAPDGRLFLTEINTGNIRIITPEGELLPDPFAHIDLAIGQESVLLGIAIDPEFEENHFVYIYLTQPADDDVEIPLGRPVLMRFTDADNEGIDPTVLIEFTLDNPELRPAGGRIQFGPDGHLYIAIGDTQRADTSLAQDLSSPFGKILRVTRDGEPAPDNPFIDRPRADPRVYAIGLRAPTGLAFEPESGRIFAADNGDLNCDELNIIEAGENYGWPRSSDISGVPCQNPGAVEPIYHYSLPGKNPEEVGSTVFPAGMLFVSGEVYPSLGDGLLVCEFGTQFMRRLQLSGPGNDQVIDDSAVVENCPFDVTLNPMGTVYYSVGREVHRLPPQ